MRRCSTPGCRCHGDPGLLHGPYRLWTRKVAGKTLTKVLTEEQYERYRSWIENSRQMHRLVSELEQLAVIAMAEQEDWPEPEPAPADRRRSPRAPIAGGEPA